LSGQRFSVFSSVALDEGATIFIAQPEYNGYNLYRSDATGLHLLYLHGAQVAFDDGRTRPINFLNTLFRPTAIVNHRLAVRTQWAAADDSQAIVLLDVSGSGDSSTERPTSSSSQKHGCGGGSAAATLLPLWLLLPWAKLTTALFALRSRGTT